MKADEMFLGAKQRSRRRGWSDPPRRLALAAFLLLGAALPVAAEDRMLPTPSQVIYPGDIIREGMLTDISIYDVPNVDGPLVESRADLLGKVATRTLLPGRAITTLAIANPRAVALGAQVKLVYHDAGLSIVTSALALEGGAVGDTIKVRNSDSGLTISGTIQPDGSVSVSDS
jgi:flagellar basal body P-ring formation protein FlgA